MKTIALSSAVMLGTFTSAVMAGPAATTSADTSAVMAEPATTSAKSPMQLLDEQLDNVTGGSALVIGTKNGNNSARSCCNGTPNTIQHDTLVT